VAACMAIDSDSPVQQVNVATLQKELKNNPLADGSTPEVLVLNDDSTSVTVKGDWKRRQNIPGCYGPSLLMEDSAAKATDSVRFTPQLKKEGDYNLYTYVVKARGASTQLNFIVDNGATQKNVELNMNDIEVKGQTEGQWVSLGKYHFEPGNKGSVTITGKNADGAVIADAVLFIPARQ